MQNGGDHHRITTVDISNPSLGHILNYWNREHVRHLVDNYKQLEGASLPVDTISLLQKGCPTSSILADGPEKCSITTLYRN